jgi:hypothetical protein
MENFDKIESYLLNRMDPDERAAFESEMQQNQSLRDEVEEMRSFILSVEYAGLKDSLKSYSIERDAADTQGDSNTSGKIVPLFSRRIVAIAASIAVIIVAGTMIYNSVYKTGSSLDHIFYPDPGLPTVMSETSEYNFYDAMVDYKMGKYELALEKWNKHTGVGADTLAYYKAMAHLNLDNWQEAEGLLLSLPAESAFSQKAKWYLVYSAVQQGDTSEARSLLLQLPDTIHGYQTVDKMLNQ